MVASGEYRGEAYSTRDAGAEECVEMVMNDMTDDGKAVLQPIDWSAPIEVLLDGSWVPARIEQRDNASDRLPYCLAYGPYFGQWFTADGKHCNDGEYVRNVQPATQTQTLTAQERLARMEALVRRMAALNPVTEVAMMHTQEFDDARALVAEMEPVVDGDVLIAREMRLEELGECASEGYKGYMNGGHYDNDDDVQKFVRAIKRGRELARVDVA